MNKSTSPELPETDNHKVSTRVESVRRFRSNRRRIDFYPSPKAQAELEGVQELNPHHTISQLLDHLVLLATSTSGNTRR